jgi:hypothetical protein
MLDKKWSGKAGKKFAPNKFYDQLFAGAPFAGKIESHGGAIFCTPHGCYAAAAVFTGRVRRSTSAQARSFAFSPLKVSIAPSSG